MDDEEALRLIAEFEVALRQSRRLYEEHGVLRASGQGIYVDDSLLKAEEHKLRSLLLPMQRIAHEVEPNLAHRLQPQGRTWRWFEAQTATQELAGFLQARERLSRILGPTGPQINAARLHPWVWSAAASLWDDGHYRSAVQAAATLIDNHLQAKLDRYDVSGSDLVTQAFSDADPQPGKPRLRLPRFPVGGPHFVDAHQGAMSFGRGCMMAIRNIVTHAPDELDEQVGLEQLAALSVLARWIDEAEVGSV
jgi:hypothetical protein